MPTTVAREAPACVVPNPILFRQPIVIVADRSQYRHRDHYLATIEDLETSVAANTFASAVVETAVIGFGPVEVLQSFRPVRHPGTTYFGWGEAGPIGPAVLRALDLVAERRRQYRHLGIRGVYTPVVVLLSDKAACGEDREGLHALRHLLDARRITCWPVVPPGVPSQTLDVWASLRAVRTTDTEGLWPLLLKLPRDPVTDLTACRRPDAPDFPPPARAGSHVHISREEEPAAQTA